MINWRKWKKALAAASLAVSIGLLAGCGGDTAKTDKAYNIGVVQLVEHGALDAANKGFVDGLASKGYKDNVKFDQQNAQADQSNLANIAQRFVSNKVDLICAIATPSAQTVANLTKDIPIVATAVTDYEEAKARVESLRKQSTAEGTAGEYRTLLETYEAQLEKLQADKKSLNKQLTAANKELQKENEELRLRFAPNAKAIGLIYCSSEVNSQKQADIMKAYTESKGIRVLEATVSTVNDIQQAAQSLVGKVDAIYVPTDNILASAMPTLASITIPAKLPVVAGADTMVKAGGIATVGIDYYKLGFQTGEMAADILSVKAKPADMPIQSQANMNITINEEYAKQIGMEIPQDIKEKAAK